MDPRGLTRDTILSLAGIVLVGGSAAVYSVVVGRVFGPAALGEAGVALAVGLGAAQLLTSGVAPAITRFGAAHRAAGRVGDAARVQARGALGALALAIALALVLAATRGLWAPAVGLSDALVAPTLGLIILQTLYITVKAALYGARRVTRYAGAEIAAALVFGVVLAALLTGADVAPIGPFLAGNAAFLAVVALGPHRLTPSPASFGRRAGAEGLWRGSGGGVEAVEDGGPRSLEGTGRRRTDGAARFVAVSTLGSAAALARLQLPVVLTSAAWPAGEVGLLTAALAFLPLVMLLPRALELALLPALAGAWGRGDRAAFRAMVRRTLRWCGMAVTGVALGLFVLGQAFLRTVYGDAFAAAVPALWAVAVAAWALGLAVPAVVALTAADRVAVPNAAGVAGLVASLVAWTWLIPTHGATGAAAGLAVGSLVNAAIPLAALARHPGMHA